VRGPLLVLLALLAAPTAGACSLAVPPPGAELAVAPEGRIAASFELGRFDVTGDPRYLAPGEAGISPDLRRAAVVRIGPDPPGTTVFDSCGGHRPRYPVLADLEALSFRLLATERVWGAGATEAHAVFRTREGLAFYGWDGAPARRVRLDEPFPASAPVSLSLSADGSRYAHPAEGGARVLDVTGERGVDVARVPGEVVLLERDRILTVALGPDANATITVRDGEGRERARVDVARLAWPSVVAPAAEGGVAVATPTEEGDASTLQVYDAQLRPVGAPRCFEPLVSGVAWDEASGRYLVALAAHGSAKATLLLMDADLTTVATRELAFREAQAGAAPWHAALEAQAQPPAATRPVPAPLMAVALALAAAMALRRR
jgi:hypothetical protein